MPSPAQSLIAGLDSIKLPRPAINDNIVKLPIDSSATEIFFEAMDRGLTFSFAHATALRKLIDTSKISARGLLVLPNVLPLTVTPTVTTPLVVAKFVNDKTLAATTWNVNVADCPNFGAGAVKIDLNNDLSSPELEFSRILGRLYSLKDQLGPNYSSVIELQNAGFAVRERRIVNSLITIRDLIAKNPSLVEPPGNKAQVEATLKSIGALICTSIIGYRTEEISDNYSGKQALRAISDELAQGRFPKADKAILLGSLQPDISN